MDQTPTARGQSLICSSAVWTTRCEQAPSVQVFGVWDSVSKVKGLQHVKQSLVHRRRRVDQKQVGTTKKFTWFKLSRYAGYQRAEFISGDVSGRVLRTLWSHPSRRASTDAPILCFYCVSIVCDKLQEVVHVKSHFSAVSQEAGQDRKFVDTSSAVSHTPQWTAALTQGWIKLAFSPTITRGRHLSNLIDVYEKRGGQ